jgi:hypothetical protein
MRDHVLILARRLFETDDIEEARGIASELQRLVRERVEELGLKLYLRKVGAAGESHQFKVVEMRSKTKF